MLKSLLTTCVAVATSVVAMAAPQVTVTYPAPGSTLNDKQFFETFNLSASGTATVAADAKATLECLDTGDVIDSTNIMNFMGTLMVKFDSSDIIENGDYELVIPAGSIIVDGEPCEKVAVSYVLEDPSLATGNFPQITLISSNPADGAGVAAIGANALNKVSFVTSDDAAVNYIGWYLYDVTNPDAPEYVYQGSENRIDYNRNGHNEDIWTNGLYITIGGEDQKLIKGHKYEMNLIFAGIGYDPVTNQYPRPDQITLSTELETSIFFEGLTPGTEYSPYTYVSVSPDPANYEIETAAQAMFSIKYSGPVKPASFIYHRGQADTPTAGTFAPVGEADSDGYCSEWEFTVYNSIASTLIGEASFYVSTKDKDGLFLKGNGGYALDDYSYNIVYEATVGLADIVAVSPVENATVETLSEIVVSNSDDLTMNFSYNAVEPARILDMFGTEIRVLGQPVAVEGNTKQMKWVFEPITASGNYVLMIPKYYFALGEEFDGTTNKNTSIRYIVEGTVSDDKVVYDIVPASVNPEDGATVNEISKVVLKFNESVFYPMSIGAPKATLINASSAAEVIYESDYAVENDYWDPTEYTFTFATPITENGNYKFTVTKGAFCDMVYDESDGTSGHASPELVYTFIIGTGSGVESVDVDAAACNVYSVDGKVVLRNASAADVKALPAGLYIFNGKKLIVR